MFLGKKSKKNVIVACVHVSGKKENYVVACFDVSGKKLLWFVLMFQEKKERKKMLFLGKYCCHVLYWCS